jgi:hypothetical protein
LLDSFTDGFRNRSPEWPLSQSKPANDGDQDMIVALLLLQAAAASPPDIELNIRATARSVRIEQKGETKLEVRAGPDAGSSAETRITPPAEGATTLRNVTVEVRAEARIGDQRQNQAGSETTSPQ